MKLRVQVKGLKEVQRRLGALGSSDLLISTATMLSRLASKSQRRIREVNLPKAFTLRRPAFIRAGVRITPATKRKLEAEVFDKDDFMVAQEESGLKHPKFGRFIAIPLRGARPTKTSLIKKANWPRAVMQAGGFIRNNVMYKTGVLEGAGMGRNAEGVRVAREGPARRKRFAGRKILPMYYLADFWKWKPRYGFRETIEAIVNAEYQEEFRRAFEQYSKR